MRKCILLPIAALTIFSACQSTGPSIAKSRSYEEQINWPEEFKPEEASFYIHNSIEINAPAEAVWRELIDATRWPEWYEGAENVQIQNGQSLLQDDSVFTWSTMGLNFVSTVKEYVPNCRLSWRSQKAVIQGYHAWLIIPRGKGVLLITDESQRGFLTFFQKVFVPNKLSRLHDIWLAGIKKRAEAKVGI
ncbi:SRPBCC domain-containing protein [Turneriella parva]|uniref:Polyketide cyclase/dehydrase n=1 Tax=Turneriella parva (strain ATCC BAA-1111 / DSM 21527 / NCTC 11395 / H) TaxID=869212 RepID=I4B6L3_TURPD|nr:SRPBCC domain-containing protein [Turneriella parva]AFM12920.1 Polyketide cyclase/dehydrase [Turneriella parva DSM 21527]